MKFDFVIGNPPYQDESVGEQKKYSPPIYHYFLEEAYKIGKCVEMIHPARFLFSAGATPKAWNDMMLQDTHLKVIYYEQDSSKVFSNTDIKGGVAITYRDDLKEFGAIGTFTIYKELNDILHKIKSYKEFIGFNTIVYGRNIYRFTNKLHEDFPDIESKLSKGHAYDLSSNVFEKIPEIFNDTVLDMADNVGIYGRKENTRVMLYTKAKYVYNEDNIAKWKVFISNINGNGVFGEMLTEPIIGAPNTCSTETFISIGAFETEQETQAVMKYIKTKFCRALLGTLKITPHNSKDTWKNIPLQDFTTSSDINWSVTIPDIDKQLYKKYNLSDEEINFIETKVKEMA